MIGIHQQKSAVATVERPIRIAFCDRDGHILWSGDVTLPEIRYTLNRCGSDLAYWRCVERPTPSASDIIRMLLELSQ